MLLSSVGGPRLIQRNDIRKYAVNRKTENVNIFYYSLIILRLLGSCLLR